MGDLEKPAGARPQRSDSGCRVTGQHVAIARALAVFCAFFVVACGAASAHEGNAATVSVTARPSAGPLIALLPPGPELVLCAQPRALLQTDAARLLWRTLVTEEREQAFIVRTGVDPAAVAELVAIAVGEDGYLLLARGDFAADAIVRAAGERLAVRDVESDEPLLRREGLTGTGRFAYAALDDNALLVAKDAPPALVGAVLSRLTDRQAVRLLDTPDADALYTAHSHQPLVLLAPRPLALSPGTPVALLMEEERALLLGVMPDQRALNVAIALRGTFPDGIEQNLRTWASSVGQSDLGRAVGLVAFAERITIQRTPEGVYARGSIDAAQLAQGVRLLFFDGMREIF